MTQQGSKQRYSTDYRRFENVPSDDEDDVPDTKTITSQQSLPAGCVCDACCLRWKNLTPTSHSAFVSVCQMMQRLAESSSSSGDAEQHAAQTCTAPGDAGLDGDGCNVEQLAALSEGVPAGLLPDEGALKRFEGALAAGSQEGAAGSTPRLSREPRWRRSTDVFASSRYCWRDRFGCTSGPARSIPLLSPWDAFCRIPGARATAQAFVSCL